mgnify:CR=1 FL=1
MNIALIYYAMGDSYNTWMMIVVLFKSGVIFLFTLVYIFFAWKNWWIAKRKGKKANPNVAEQQFYEEKDVRDEDFDKIMNQTSNPFFHEDGVGAIQL